jgi:hypothetical protein
LHFLAKCVLGSDGVDDTWLLPAASPPTGGTVGVVKTASELETWPTKLKAMTRK